MIFKTTRALSLGFFLGTASVFGLALAASTPALAQKITNPAIGKPLQEAQALASAGNFKGALAKAREADAVGGKSGAEAAAINQLIAYYAVQAGDSATALATFDKMIASGQGNRQENLKNAMSMALKMGNTQRAVGYANQMGGGDQTLIAQAYYQAGNFKEAIRLLRPGAEKGTASATALEALRASYYKLGDSNGQQFALEQLAARFPKPEYWRELARVVQREKGLPDAGLLEVYRLRYAVGDLKTADEYSEMAQVAIQMGFPGEAKSVLDKAQAQKLLSGERATRLINMTNGLVAKDAAVVATLQQQAANPADGNADVKLAEIMWSYGKFKEAEGMVRKGIKEGKLTNPDHAKIILGHALLSQGNRGEALAAFNSVPRASKMGSVARLWSLYARRG